MKKNFYNAYFHFEKNHWLMKVRRRIIFDMIEKNISTQPKNTKILDFGCASGLLVNELTKKNYLAYGIDISKEAIEFGRNQGTNNLQISISQKIKFPSNNFDLVLALDVLEHLKDEKKVLQEIHRVLKTNGIFIITVPAFKFLWGSHDDISHHYRRYTLNNLLKTIINNGTWKTIKSSYFNTILFPPIAAIRIGARLLNLNQRGSDFNLNNKFLDSIFFNIFNLERSWLKNNSFPFGVSILLILQKKVK